MPKITDYVSMTSLEKRVNVINAWLLRSAHLVMLLMINRLMYVQGIIQYSSTVY